jgi:hypothetical protein
MKINDKVDFIRQQHPGQFRRPEDGEEPYAHVKGQKLDTTNVPKARSVYIENEYLVSWDKNRAPAPKLLDYDAGVKLDTERLTETNKNEKEPLNYDRDGKTQTMSTREVIIDQWA